VLSVLVSLFLFVSALVFVLGTAGRLIQYARTPAPLKIPTTPAPTSRLGVGVRLLREVVLFESLFKASRWTWLFGWTFHLGLAWLAVGHLRFFVSPDSMLLEIAAHGMTVAGWLTLWGLLGVLARRVLVDRVRYVSAPSDFLMLGLLLALVASGLLLHGLSLVDFLMFRAYIQGLYAGHLVGLPNEPLLLSHLALAGFLAIVFPFSKLLHGLGVFFSPTRYQVDDSRRRRGTKRPLL